MPFSDSTQIKKIPKGINKDSKFMFRITDIVI